MSDEPIKEGDTVMLKSGGPVMTVNEASTNSANAICVWFSSNSERCEGRFSKRALKKVSPEN